MKNISGKKRANAKTKIFMIGSLVVFLYTCVPGEEPKDQAKTMAIVGLNLKEEDPMAKAILGGEKKLPNLPAIDKQITTENQAYIDEFQQQAGAICTEPCVIPEEETDPDYQLQAEEIQAISEHTALMKEKGQDTEIIRLKRTIINGNLYVRSILYSDKPAEMYMLRSIRDMDERITTMPNEFLMASVQMLTIQIRNRNDSLKNFENGMYGAYHDFALSEIRVLIQLRRRFLDETRKRNI